MIEYSVKLHLFRHWSKNKRAVAICDYTHKNQGALGLTVSKKEYVTCSTCKQILKSGEEK